MGNMGMDLNSKEHASMMENPQFFMGADGTFLKKRPADFEKYIKVSSSPTPYFINLLCNRIWKCLGQMRMTSSRQPPSESLPRNDVNKFTRACLRLKKRGLARTWRLSRGACEPKLRASLFHCPGWLLNWRHRSRWR